MKSEHDMAVDFGRMLLSVGIESIKITTRPNGEKEVTIVDEVGTHIYQMD